ncbi:PilT protein domain protein [Ferroglobus placidus DSM 10642]|uniref:Ribonuclease VapC n=1 Tax=Ferroglobus placidus (strain DSM 10642 / AEDII12DO) TaxID=589924 RepID=D3RZM8_FERPA|nr:type II toxin-antitoxin system VapC family toxin [Ferroglobus placidus]ADC65941.1 PilT protein domain protein [Ferroglobus placidus DSM 10642]
MEKLKIAYIDSNIFIYTILYSGDAAEKSRDFLRKAAEGEYKAYTSSLVWDEVVYAVRKVAGLKESIKAGEILLKLPFIEFLSVDYAVCEKAQKLVENYGILPRDAIHASLALKYCEGVIISNDSDFDIIKGLKRVF